MTRSSRRRASGSPLRRSPSHPRARWATGQESAGRCPRRAGSRLQAISGFVRSSHAQAGGRRQRERARQDVRDEDALGVIEMELGRQERPYDRVVQLVTELEEHRAPEVAEESVVAPDRGEARRLATTTRPARRHRPRPRPAAQGGRGSGRRRDGRASAAPRPLPARPGSRARRRPGRAPNRSPARPKGTSRRQPPQAARHPAPRLGRVVQPDDHRERGARDRIEQVEQPEQDQEGHRLGRQCHPQAGGARGEAGHEHERTLRPPGHPDAQGLLQEQAYAREARRQRELPVGRPRPP